MKKRKHKSKSLLEAERQMDLFLKKVGFTGKYAGKTPHEIPTYKVEANTKTSDSIPTKTPKKPEQKYSGTEIAGIVVTHKSNLMPVRKDNPQAAIDAAQMRRS